MTTGAKIRKYRLEKGLTQKELSEKLGVSGSFIGQYENDTRTPKMATLNKIANALEIDSSCLISDPPITFEVPMAEVVEYYGPFISDVEKNFNKLNKDGRTKVVEYAADLSENPKYKK